MKSFATALIALAALSTNAATVIGMEPCTNWTKDAKSFDKIKHDVHGVWLIGYLSGANVRSQVDFLAGSDSKAIIAWMDNYCAANPLDNSQIAAENLIKTLSARKPN